MSENMNSEGAAAPSAKHRGRNAEGSVRVLGQTAAVAGISGALLLALKAMVLVSPAVLPNSDGLDALGRPNPIVDASDSTLPPVVFAPAANPIAQGPAPVGSSERTGVRSPSSPEPVTTPSRDVASEKKDTTKPKPSTPSTGGGNEDTPKSGVGKVTKPITDAADGLLGTDLGKTADDLGNTVEGTVEKVPVAGKPVAGLVDTVGETANETLSPVTTTVTGTLGGATGGLGLGL